MYRLMDGIRAELKKQSNSRIIPEDQDVYDSEQHTKVTSNTISTKEA